MVAPSSSLASGRSKSPNNMVLRSSKVASHIGGQNDDELSKNSTPQRLRPGLSAGAKEMGEKLLQHDVSVAGGLRIDEYSVALRCQKILIMLEALIPLPCRISPLNAPLHFHMASGGHGWAFSTSA